MKKFFLLLIVAWLCASPVLLRAFTEQKAERPQVATPENKKRETRQPLSRRHSGRALLENAALVTGSTIDYWRTYANFKEDWQFRFTWRDQRRRFFTAESPRLDSNSFWFNWSHAASGAAYYNFGRINGLNSRSSFLLSLGLSAFWECVSEWREVISINDMITTPFGGPAIGEPLFQAASYFSRRKGLFNRLAGFLCNPFLVANNWFDRKEGNAANSAPDPSPSWHRFSLFVGSKNGSLSPPGAGYHRFSLGLDMEITTIPGYGEARSLGRYLSDTLSSRIFLAFDYGSAGLEEFNIRTQTVLFGYVWQSLGEGKDGSLDGSGGSLGLGCGFDLFKKRAVAWYDGSAETQGGGNTLVSDARFIRPTPTQFTDKLSVVNLLGPVLELSRFSPQLHLRWTAEAYGDFAMVNALAYNRYTQNHDVRGVKSTLLSWGYYYALGMTLATGLAADWWQFRLRGAASLECYDSIQGLDRFQFLGVVTDDFKIRDSRRIWRLSLGYVVPHMPIELAVTVEGIGRRGNILEVSDHYQENKIYYHLNVLF